MGFARTITVSREVQTGRAKRGSTPLRSVRGRRVRPGEPTLMAPPVSNGASGLPIGWPGSTPLRGLIESTCQTASLKLGAQARLHFADSNHNGEARPAMNGNQRIIRSTASAKHTGVVWQFDFPYPDESFLNNFDWRVLHPDGRVLEFEGHFIRKSCLPDGTPILSMRFRDRGWTLQPEGTRLVAELHSPAA